MSFEEHSELPPHLLALAQLTHWHARSAQQPLEVRFQVEGKQLENLSYGITGQAQLQAPLPFQAAATQAVKQLVEAGSFDAHYDVRINSSPEGQLVIKQRPLSASGPEEAPAPQPAVSHSGLQLRAALLKYQHTGGYNAQEIAAQEAALGVSFTPDFKFYRSLVKEGLVAHYLGQEVYASPAEADFGASQIPVDSPLPAGGDAAVQGLLTHRLWVEFAHSDQQLFALDFAPAAQGQVGQVLARQKGQASLPVKVADSLADFIIGVVPAQSAPVTAGRKPGQTLAWAGQVEAVALPALLGWTLAPSTVYRLEEDQEPEEQAPLEDPVAPSSETQVEGESEASTVQGLFSEPLAEEPALGYLAVESQEAAEVEDEPGTSRPQVASLADQVASLATSPITQVSVPQSPLEPAQPATASLAQQEAAPSQEAQDLDPGVARNPLSPEQQAMAQSMATLAFGSKEEREPYSDPESPSPRHKLAREEESQAPQEEPSEQGKLVSALRKFFIGD